MPTPHRSIPNPSIALVVFDLGKVLVDFDYGIASRQLSQFSDHSPSQIVELLLQTPLLLRYERGELTSAEFYQAIVELTGLRAPFDEFAARFGDIFSPIPSMIELFEQIRLSGHPTALLSNTNELAIRHIRSQFPFFTRFDHHVLSFEHNAMKPESALYRVLEGVTGVPAPQILFLDDRPENVEAAQQLGWHAFVHHDPESTRKSLAGLGLLPA